MHQYALLFLRRLNAAAGFVPNHAQSILLLGVIPTPTAPDIHPLVDELVSTGKECWRHGETQRCRRLQIDHQLETSWLQYRQIQGLVAVQYFADVDSRLPISVEDAGAIAHQSP